VDLGRFFSFLILYTVGTTVRPRPLPAHRTTQTQNKRTHIYASNRIRTHDSIVRAGEDSWCLRPRDHCDGHYRIWSAGKCKYRHVRLATAVTIGRCRWPEGIIIFIVRLRNEKEARLLFSWQLLQNLCPQSFENISQRMVKSCHSSLLNVLGRRGVFTLGSEMDGYSLQPSAITATISSWFISTLACKCNSG
jgi:hypothetical protein